MDSQLLDIHQWAENNFGACQLGDQRRTNRLVKYAAQVAACSEGSTPNQTESWADCKAAYRLFDEQDVSFEAVCGPHWNRTKNRESGVFLLLGDTTEIDFGYDPSVTGLGPVGSGNHHGFHLHSSLMIDAQSDEIVGMAGAEIFHRQPKPKREKTRAKKNRPRESEVWGRVIDSVGKPRGTARFIHVLDAGADNFEVFCHLQQQDVGWVVRVSQKHRIVLDSKGQRRELSELLQHTKPAGMYKLFLRSRKNQPAREALLEVRFTPLEMPIPAQPTPYMKTCGIQTIPMFAIHVREIAPPEGVEPLDWILLTSEPLECFEDAWTVIGYYEKRWRVEDYHKCLKTGCQVQSRQYKTSDRLERVTGLLSIVAVRLLRLKFAARTEPSQPAKNIVPPEWIKVLKQVRNITRPIETARDFLREVAKFGGFLGRKSDGEPGWITIWRGLDKLILCLRGARWAYNKCG
jgi:Transposase DNA-binding/Transposase Tn5 dimerisation domain